MSDDELLTIQQVIEILALKRRAIYKRIADGRLPAINAKPAADKPDYRFRRRDVERLAQG